MASSRADDRIPPSDRAAEESVIGACLLARSAVETACAVLRPSDFWTPRHQQVFDVISVLHAAGEPVDPTTVTGGLAAGSADTEAEVRLWLRSLLVDTPSVGAVGTYAHRVLRHAKSRQLIWIAAELADAGYEGQPAGDVASRVSAELLDSELLRRYDQSGLRGYYDDILELDTGLDRDDSQPWIARGLIRRGQRLLVVAGPGVGKSVLLRQLAYCAENGVHPWTGQVTERPIRALIVELEGGTEDVVASNRDLLLPLARIMHYPSGHDVARPALLHRPGGLDVRAAAGRAALEAAIQKRQPELVVMGPLKYMQMMQPGENYETSALALHAVLNDLTDRYKFAVALEAHFSRGDHGAPGGAERWVDWPDVGFGIYAPDDDRARRLDAGGDGIEMPVKQFRQPRDSAIWLPVALIRGASRRLPWSVDDRPDPYHAARSVFTSRYGGIAGHLAQFQQGEF